MVSTIAWWTASAMAVWYSCDFPERSEMRTSGTWNLLRSYAVYERIHHGGTETRRNRNLEGQVHRRGTEKTTSGNREPKSQGTGDRGQGTADRKPTTATGNRTRLSLWL